MTARNFVFLLLATWLLSPAAARAVDTALSGEELLGRCKGTPEMMRADTLYCKGYLEALEDSAADARASASSGAGPAAFCVPAEGVTDEQLRQAFMKWGQEHASELRQSAAKTALAALRAAYPCAPK